MAEQNELPVVADVFTMQALVPGERAVHYSRLLVEVPRGTKLTDHATATARIAALEAKITEQAMQYLALDTQHQQALEQLEEARKDARVYQWLRDNQEGDWAVCEWDEVHGNYYRDMRCKDVVDAAIASAIKAADGGGK